MHGPPGTVCLLSTWLPGKGTKHTPNPQRLSQNCVCVSPVEVRVSSGLPQGQGLWVLQTWVWHKPSWKRLPLTPPRNHQNLHKTGETNTWRAPTKPCVHQDPGERSSEPTETDPDLPVSVWEYLAEAWVSSGLLQGQRHRVQQCMHRTF